MVVEVKSKLLCIISDGKRSYSSPVFLTDVALIGDVCFFKWLYLDP